IVFLGTPHRGSDTASMGQIVANLAKVAFRRPQTQLLEMLEKDSHELDALSHEFSLLHSALKIFSCFKQKETKIRRGWFGIRSMVGVRI
ncbi:hypothetical protein BDD12DRAFT_763082, partial [Trichophaea hybrida]